MDSRPSDHSRDNETQPHSGPGSLETKMEEVAPAILLLASTFSEFPRSGSSDELLFKYRSMLYNRSMLVNPHKENMQVPCIKDIWHLPRKGRGCGLPSGEQRIQFL